MKTINTITLQHFKSKLVALIDAKADISHTHTKAQIGLGNVDNTSDANKPISTATQTALDGKAAASHTHTKAQVGLANVDNTSDANKPISTATQTALDGKAAASHSHSKAQIGLGRVDNTNDAEKPISTATQTALNAKADTTSLNAHTNNTDIHVTTTDKSTWNEKMNASGTNCSTAGASEILNKLTLDNTVPTDAASFICQYQDGTQMTFYRRPLAFLWTWIKTKLNSETLGAINATIQATNINGVLPVANGGTGNSSVDTVPTLDSPRVVTSGGLFRYTQKKFEGAIILSEPNVTDLVEVLRLDYTNRQFCEWPVHLEITKRSATYAYLDILILKHESDTIPVLARLNFYSYNATVADYVYVYQSPGGQVLSFYVKLRDYDHIFVRNFFIGKHPDNIIGSDAEAAYSFPMSRLSYPTDFTDWIVKPIESANNKKSLEITDANKSTYIIEGFLVLDLQYDVVVYNCSTDAAALYGIKPSALMGGFDDGHSIKIINKDSAGGSISFREPIGAAVDYGMSRFLYSYHQEKTDLPGKQAFIEFMVWGKLWYSRTY